MSGPQARQGEVWDANLNPTEGREQAGIRPVLAVSVDQLGTGPADLVIAVPLTRTDRGNAMHVRIEPPEGGLVAVSFALPEQIRSIARSRLAVRRGAVRDETLEEVLRRIRVLTRSPH